MCCIKHDNIVVEESAEDFSTTEPHSIQSITKLHVHLIVGQLLRDGVLSLDARVVDYLLILALDIEKHVYRHFWIWR